jgi:hypothetical protein
MQRPQCGPLLSEGLRLRKAALVSLFAGMICISGWGQEHGGVGGVESFGVSSTYSADSSHIIIGASERRRVWTLGVEFTHRLVLGEKVRLDYEGSLLPLYEETDPTLLGANVTVAGQTVFTPQAPVRVVQVAHGPVGTELEPSGIRVPIFAVFGRQDTYAWSLAPLGARVSLFPRWRIQPSLALDGGFVVSARDIPVDDSDQFNYMFSFGPGVQVFTSPKASWRVEYIYRHISNAHQGNQNPGVDQGVVRVTLSTHR